MSPNYVIDAYAWVEHLLGPKAGAAAKQYIEGGSASTPPVAVAELRRWYLREIEAKRRRERVMVAHLASLASRTNVVPLDTALAPKAGETDLMMKKRIRDRPVADSVILATANQRAAKVVTCDPHFKRPEDVTYVG